MDQKFSEIVRCVVLGIVQGLTEFLPVSSSFHLRVVPELLGWPEPGLALSVFLHIGTLAGIFLFFGKDLFEIAVDFCKSIFASNFSFAALTSTLGWKIIIGSLPAIFIGFFFHDYLETIDKNLYITPFALVIVGILLWVSDLGQFTKPDMLNNLTVGQSFLIGLGQALALIPGVSRSGSTMMLARFLSFSREDAAKFSFLLGTPVIFGAGLLELVKVFKHPEELHVSWVACLLGCIASAIVGFFAIKFLVKFLQSHSLFWFMIYRVVFGSVVLVGLFKGLIK
jgi:undecaprenyl-diphosphatase